MSDSSKETSFQSDLHLVEFDQMSQFAILVFCQNSSHLSLGQAGRESFSFLLEEMIYRGKQFLRFCSSVLLS